MVRGWVSHDVKGRYLLILRKLFVVVERLHDVLDLMLGSVTFEAPTLFQLFHSVIANSDDPRQAWEVP